MGLLQGRHLGEGSRTRGGDPTGACTFRPNLFDKPFENPLTGLLGGLS